MSKSDMQEIKLVSGREEIFVPITILKTIPYFCEELKKQSSTTELVLNPNLSFLSLRYILNFLRWGENRERINCVGALRSLRATAHDINFPNILEQFVKSEKEAIPASWFMSARYPAAYILKHYKDLPLAAFLENEYLLTELIDGGANKLQLQRIHFTVKDIEGNKANYAKKLKELEFSAKELRSQNGFSIKELEEADFGFEELKEAALLTTNIWGAMFVLKNAGFSLNQFINSSFHPTWEPTSTHYNRLKEFYNNLRLIGFGIKEFNEEGTRCSQTLAQRAGFTAQDFKIAGYNLKEIWREFDPKTCKDAGYSLEELYQCYDFWPLCKEFTLDELKKVLTIPELIRGGFNKKTLEAAGLTLTLEELKKSLSAYSLVKAGFSITELRAAGFTPDKLKYGVSIEDLVSSFSITELRAAGFTLDKLKNCIPIKELVASFSITELRATGFTLDELKRCVPIERLVASFSITALVSSFSITELRAAGFTLDKLKYCILIKELVSSFSITELRATGFTLDELKRCVPIEGLVASFSITELRAAGFTLDKLKDCVPIKELVASFSITELRAVGFTPDELKGREPKSDPEHTDSDESRTELWTPLGSSRHSLFANKKENFQSVKKFDQSSCCNIM